MTAITVDITAGRAIDDDAAASLQSYVSQLADWKQRHDLWQTIPSPSPPNPEGVPS